MVGNLQEYNKGRNAGEKANPSRRNILEAKDTVIERMVWLQNGMREPTFNDQAEISFNAGYDKKASECPDCTLQNFDRGVKAGIREVVEWVENYTENNAAAPNFYINWHKKLKEWGIDG